MVGLSATSLRAAAICGLGVLLAAGTGVAANAAPECGASPARDEVLVSVGPHGELAFASGFRAVLDGLRWPADDGDGARAWVMRFAGRGLSVVPRGETDRWGRAHVDATVPDEAIDLAGGLIGAGLAHADAGERDALCRPALLLVEDGARAAGRGVWQAQNRDVRDGAGLRGAVGRFVVAQGRVVTVGERPARTYIDFVRRGEDGLTVTVSKRTWRQLQERGLTAPTLKGRLVRVRGVVEVWRGPTLDIASADMIEILDEERALRR